MSKTALRENRASGGTHSKVERIIKELAKYPKHLQPRHPNGIYAAYREGQRIMKADRMNAQNQHE